MPAGRKPKLNWTPFLGQYTTTIEGKFHRLGTDKDEAEKQFRFLLTKHDMAEPVTCSPTFGEVSEDWLAARREDARRRPLSPLQSPHQ